ncbi:hypothetical protein FGO68_gene10460 [Halteria grandinella]|uniref:Uncharacterized protein n=1 Tax=Halteria grandinella TaxID=5974 RepID=A0A8J8SXY6_HALGN|nr:hypothetical protein FGO68_gene10460 [Halteria grandinella]
MKSSVLQYAWQKVRSGSAERYSRFFIINRFAVFIYSTTLSADDMTCLLLSLLQRSSPSEKDLQEAMMIYSYQCLSFS